MKQPRISPAQSGAFPRRAVGTPAAHRDSRALARLAGALLAGAFLTAGCAVGPDYKRPPVPTAATFAEPGPWKTAEPRDGLPKPEWWKVFHDPALDALEAQAQTASPTLQSAMARYDAALAVARISRSALIPGLAVNPSGARERFSGHRQVQPGSTRFAYTTNTFDVPLDLTYELDIFGQARRALESAREAAAAQGALYQNVLLTLEAGVAQNYFSLRALLSQQALLRQNVSLLSDTLDLVRKLRKGGVNSDLDLYQAQAQLEAVQSTALAVDQSIATQLHALAVLIGKTPESFSIAAMALDLDPPEVPVGLPSDLLERRPDVAAAERTLASLNAQVGVAKAAFFPSIGLTAYAGLNSNDLNNLISSGSREWGVGPAISIPIFRGGALIAGYDVAKANYQAAVAAYQGQVLSAFQDVEDGLSNLRYLAQQSEVLDHAVKDSQKVADISTLRYKNGLVSYLEVIDAQRTLLQNQISFANTRAQRFISTVLLVKAVGGGWQPN